MLTAVVIIYSLYFLADLYVSTMQIGFIAQAKRKKPILLDSASYIKAANYAVQKERISMAKSFVDYIVVLAWITGGISYLHSVIFIQNEALRNVIIVLAFVFINGIIFLPFSIYEKFVLDQKFGFNNSTLSQYIKDLAITTILTAVFGGLVAWGIYFIISSFALWWLYGFAFIFAVVILINMFFPTIRALFFDKLSALDDKELEDEIAALMDKTGFVSSGVFVSDASKRDSRLNAYFGGLGKSKRVVLFDTLLKKLSKKELLAVLGHELGHFAHGDIYKNIAITGVVLFVMFFIFGNLPTDLYLQMGLAPAPYLIIILFLIFMPVMSFVLMPIIGLVSRHNEFEADDMGAKLGGKAELASALQKLVQENKSFPLSHPIYIFFHYTHPPVIERLKVLGVDICEDRTALEGPCVE